MAFLGLYPVFIWSFLDDRTNGRAYATRLRPSVVCDVCDVAKR